MIHSEQQQMYSMSLKPLLVSNGAKARVFSVQSADQHLLTALKSFRFRAGTEREMPSANIDEHKGQSG